MPKIIKVGQCFTELFTKLHWHSFLRHGVVSENIGDIIQHSAASSTLTLRRCDDG